MFSAVDASQAGEIVSLLLIVLLVPATLLVVRDLRHPGRVALTIGFLTVAAVRLFSLVERFVFGNPVFPVKQFMLAGAGVAFAVGLWRLALAMRRGELA